MTAVALALPAAGEKSWADAVVLPEVVPGGSRPASGQIARQSSSSVTSRQSSAGTRRRETAGSSDEGAVALPSIVKEAVVGADGARRHSAVGADGELKLKGFGENIDRFTSQEEAADRRGRAADRAAISHGRSLSESAGLQSGKNTPRGDNGGSQSGKSTPRGSKKSRKSQEASTVLAAAYGVSPYMKELKVPKKKVQVEPSIDEAKRPEAQHRKKYIKMLKTMEEESRRAKEETERKLAAQQQAREKLKAKMGVDNVAARVFEAARRPSDAAHEEPATRAPHVRNTKAAEDEDEDDAEKLAARKAKAKEAKARNKELLERSQKMLMQLAERRAEEEREAEEQRRKQEKIREKLRKAAIEAAERARAEEAEGADAAATNSRLVRRKDGEDGDGAASPKRGEVEKAIRERTRRYQDRFSSEAEEEAWLRKKYGASETDKLFNISGAATSYEGVRRALLARGWKEHREEESMIFDLKWTIKTSDIAFKALHKDQLVNHFARNGNLTTKVGLTRNLRNLKWFEDVDMDEFFPRSYDLADPDELADFIDDFKMGSAEIVLKLFVRDGSSMKDCQGRDVGAANYGVLVQLALLVLEAHVRRCKVIDIDDDESHDLRLTPLEWTLLLGEACPTSARDKREALSSISEAEGAAGGLAGGVQSGFGTQWNQAAQLKRQRTLNYTPYGGIQQGGLKGVGAGKGLLSQQEYDSAFLDVAHSRKFPCKNDAGLRERAEALLKELREMNTQSSLSGYSNVWIVKPAGKSRGRDILCINSINRLLDYIGYGVAGKEMHWVVQKYMERPYLINQRKFDFRQWVMVTDWNPLTVWFYDESYLRFSMADFSLNDLADSFTHLCNNSIQKEMENFEAVKKESMWDLATFRQHLVTHHPNGAVGYASGEALWQDKILPQMQNITRWALMCAQDMLENRKNSCEVYGYDFMLDEEFNIWLLEVNASPDMSPSTDVTERLTERVMDDMIKVMVDASEFCWGRHKHQHTCSVPTGGWELIHRGEAEVSFPISAFGCKLALTGKEIEIPRVYAGAVPTYSKAGSKRETRAEKLREEVKKKEEERAREEERKREEKKALLKAEVKRRRKEEKRRLREQQRLLSEREGSVDPAEGCLPGAVDGGGDGEVLDGWGDEDGDAGLALGMNGPGLAVDRGHAGLAEEQPGAPGQGWGDLETKEPPRDQRQAKKAAVVAARGESEARAFSREKVNPRNASQRLLQPANKQVLACNVVSLGDPFGSALDLPFS